MQHEHRLRVRYGETDQMGVAHHASYVIWLEEARIEWLRAQGHNYKDMEIAGLMLPVIDLQVRYRASARFDDELTLITNAEIISPTRLLMRTEITGAQVTGERSLVAEGRVTLAAVNREGRPIRLPASLVSVVSGP